MRYYEVAPTQIIRQDSAVFTYASEQELSVGQIIEMEVGRKSLVGIVMREVAKPKYDTKLVKNTVINQPLPIQLVRLSTWLSDYYATHLALVLQAVLPGGIQKKRRQRTQAPPVAMRVRTKKVLNKYQVAALDKIDAMSSGTALLHGVTGSGKTTVYIEAAKQTLNNGRSVMILVPEIALTPQIVDEFSSHFENIVLTHSRQTEAERHLAWKDVLESTSPRVVIGPRSALFLPLENLGLIVIDEAHEPSFKQEQSPRYSALRAASVLAREHEAKLILGSATPSIADFYLAQKSTRPIIELPQTARLAKAPTVTLVDMTKRHDFQRHRFFSNALLGRLEMTVASGYQALIFHNRRGSANVTLCKNCGWQSTCQRCFIPLTLHTDTYELRCHICGTNGKVPTNCPDCSNVDIIHKGVGTKLIESELTKLYPNMKIARFDGDSAPENSINSRYKELYDGSIDIIIGTQIVAKGLDLPRLRTVGIVQADAGLNMPDFAAPERTFQLLAQAIGRVGRSNHETYVVVQSYRPTHPSVVDGLSRNYADFYEKTLAERRRGSFPPFTFLLKLTCVYKSEAAAIRNARLLAQSLRKKIPASVEILGPTPAFYERQRDTYRWQLILKSKTRSHLVDALVHVPQTHWQFELDPVSLL